MRWNDECCMDPMEGRADAIKVAVASVSVSRTSGRRVNSVRSSAVRTGIWIATEMPTVISVRSKWTRNCPASVDETGSPVDGRTVRRP
jgi:hypothetical protein